MEKFGFENTDWNQIGSSSCNWNAPDSAEKREAFFSLSRFASDAVSNESNYAAEAQMQMNDTGKIEAFKDRSNEQREDGEESPAAKKRKRSSGDQEMELNQIQDAAKDASNSKKKAERRSSSKMAALKPSGKVSREVEEDDKEEYIHV